MKDIVPQNLSTQKRSVGTDNGNPITDRQAKKTELSDVVMISAFVASPYASVVLDRKGQILVCNRRARQMFFTADSDDADITDGRPFHEFTRHTQFDLLEMLRSGAARGTVTLRMNDHRKARREIELVFRVTLLRSQKQGERLYLLTQDQLKASANALSNMNTRRKQARDNLLQLKAAHLELHQSLISLEAFSRAASHDLRTPLNTISGMLELFGSKFGENLPDNALQYLSVMARAVTQMSTLTDDLLDHAKSTSPEIAAERVDLENAVRQVCMDMDGAIQLVSGQVDIRGNSFDIMTEPLLLHVLVSNIVSNALKYRTPDRDPHIVIEFLPVAEGIGQMLICDNGVGFDQAQALDIFEPFRQLESDVDGSGIGLSTCAEICRRHGWEISARGHKGEGAEFVITF